MPVLAMIDELGGWTTGQAEHFNDGSIFDSYYGVH